MPQPGVTLLTNWSVKMQLIKNLFQPTCPLPVKRERRKEARPGELLQAALTLFVEKGFAATKVEDVARMAGVSKGTLFLYFSSKEEIVQSRGAGQDRGPVVTISCGN